MTMTEQLVRALLVLAGALALFLSGCGSGTPTVTPTPTKTPVPAVAPSPSPEPSATLAPSPTQPDTPSPTAQQTSTTATPATPTYTPQVEAAPATSTPPPPLATITATALSRPPLPPQQGGEWDMEAGFVPGVSPLGEDCPGWHVAVGWTGFAGPGEHGSSCLNENKNPANVRSGQRSQEMTFDFISAEAGIYRHAQTIPGHRYRIEAWGKHVFSASPVVLFLGVDLAGGEDWRAASVTWYDWDEAGEDVWVFTEVTVRAPGDRLTIFLKGHHLVAVRGGATLFDDVRVTDLGP
jgi:hypothetical protein